MEKRASRKWKEMLGALSPENEKRLVKSRILNYHREAKGLNEGSRRLAQRYNIKINNSGFDTRVDKARIFLSNKYYDPFKSKASEYLRSYGREHGLNEVPTKFLAQYHKHMVDGGVFDRGIKRDVNHMITNKGKRRIAGPDAKFRRFYDSVSGQVITNRNGSLSGLVRANPDYFSRVKGVPDAITKNSDLKFQNNALALRHEIDEVITRMKQRRSGNIPALRSLYVTHAAPSIIHKESANVSTLHPTVRDYWRKNRAKPHSDKAKSQLELLKSTGVDYGKSGKFNRKAAIKNDKSYYEFLRKD